MKGFEAASKIVRENAEKQAQYEKDKAEGKTRFTPWPCYIKGGQEADISFLVPDEPVTLLTHHIGERYTPRVCLGAACPYCAKGKLFKPSYRSFFTVVDHRENKYQNREGVEVTSKDNLRYLEMSTAQCEALSVTLKKNKVKDITAPVINITKSGSGKSTTTQFFITERDETHNIPDNAQAIDFEALFKLSTADAMREAMSGEVARYE